MSWLSKLFGGSQTSTPSVAGCRCSVCSTTLQPFATQGKITVTSPDQLRGKAIQCAKCGKISCSNCLATIPPGMQGCPHCKSIAMRPYSGS
jgi:hypothetical protein